MTSCASNPDLVSSMKASASSFEILLPDTLPIDGFVPRQGRNASSFHHAWRKTVRVHPARQGFVFRGDLLDELGPVLVEGTMTSSSWL
jgi:hypothetical protein